MATSSTAPFKGSDHSYCSQLRRYDETISNRKQGIVLVTQILAQQLICRHDVNCINEIYAKLGELDRKKIKQISSAAANSEDQSWTPSQEIVLKLLSAKIGGLFNSLSHGPTVTAESIIMLHHFKRLSFSHFHSLIESIFEHRLRQVSKEDIASNLPFCYSEKIYEEDVQALIGTSYSNETTETLKRTKEKFKGSKNKPELIAIKKKELALLQKKLPQQYPAYLGELLNSGCLDLYEHILQMKELVSREKCRESIQKMSFSSIAQIVLETKEVVVQKVRNAIQDDCKNILFLLGGSGAGKSTTLCFFRGDSMELQGFQYESKKDRNLAQQMIIGHSLSSSFTFLPNVGIFNGWAIVDFPGFEDSNGPVISMAMECALKALIKEYRPKILVLEAITNTEGRFSAVGKLANRLQRILGNKQHCLLGITKYSKEPNFLKLRQIEEQQKKDLFSPSKEEIELSGQVSLLADLVIKMPTLAQQKEKIEKELKRIKEAREALQGSLPETEEKRKSREQIKKIEEEMLNQTGLSRLIPLYDLEKPGRLTECLKILLEMPKTDAGINNKLYLDAEDAKLLDDRFENDLLEKIESGQKARQKFKNIEAFKRKVLDTSIVFTMTDDSPEIGQFLHMPEMDPSIVRRYDKRIVSRCIKDLMESVIANLNVSEVEKVIEQYQNAVDAKIIKDLRKKLDGLRKYVMGLLGRPLNGDQNQAEQEWIKVEKEYAVQVAAAKQKLRVPLWLEIALGIPLGIPFGIYYLVNTLKLKGQESSIKVKQLKEYEESIDKIHEALGVLKDLERTIEKRDVVDQAFSSVHISLTSLASIEASVKERIDKVKAVYGDSDWQMRIDDFHKKLFSSYSFKLLARELGLNLMSSIVASLFDASIEWRVIKEGPQGDEALAVYTWDNFSPRETLRRSFNLDPNKGEFGVDRLDRSDRLTLNDLKNTDSVKYKIEIKRKEGEEVTVIEDRERFHKIFKVLSESWEEVAMSPIKESVDVKTPLMLVTLGAALLKEAT